MQGKGAEGLAAQHPEHPAANEQFPAMGDGVDAVAQPGWDPYQVWQTRVKTSPQSKKERESEREPLG